MTEERSETLQANEWGGLARRVTALESAVTAHAAALGLSPPGADLRSDDPLRVVWDESPLAARIAFVRAVLTPDHPRQGALSEAITLVELSTSPEEFRAWIGSYPALFAEASAKLVALVPLDPKDPETRLAGEVLVSAREAVAKGMATVEVSWIAPLPGDLITGDCEVIGEARSADVPEGRVHTLRRPGFRQGGSVALRAQVLRAVVGGVDAPAQQIPVAAELKASESAPQELGSITNLPDWLCELRRRAVGNSPVALTLMSGVLRLAGHSRTANDREICAALEPLLPLLGAGWSAALAEVPGDWLEEFARQKPRLEQWLQAECGAELITPREGEPFDATAMEITGERRTAHVHERGTVARVHRAGLRVRGSVLIRAQISRYSHGGLA